MSQAVYDPKTGSKTSFKAFKEVAQKIDSTYNKRWLKTEQNFAYGSLLMSEKWHKFDPEAMLQYKTAGDAVVRDSHRAWHDVKKPKNDPFWQSCYPPNGWGCRCTVLETNDEKPTPPGKTAPITEESVPKMFQTNVAEKGLVFPEKHPYFVKVPKGTKKEVEKQAEEVMKEVEKKEERNKTYTPEVVKEKRAAVVKAYQAIINEKNLHTGINIASDNLVTKSLNLRRGDYKEILNHRPDVELLDYLPKMHEKIQDWEYVGYSNVEEGKHKDWLYVFIYKFQYNKKTYYINVPFKNDLQEHPYIIYKSQKMPQKGIPEEVKKILKERNKNKEKK